MKAITFKGEKLTRTKVTNRILKMWGLCEEDERFDWYQDANKFATHLAIKNVRIGVLKKDSRLIPKIVGVVAALSPVKTWEQNKKIAVDLVETGDCGHMKQFKNKAKEILKSDGSDEQILAILKGRKISSFYLNIMYPHKANHVTIDRHALSISLGKWVKDEDYSGMTANQYEFFVQCYIGAAMKAKVSPLLMQSATWVRFRKIKRDYR